MPWTPAPGLAGKVFVPDKIGRMRKKHPCGTCFTCQWCDENRCRVCRNDRTETHPSDPSQSCTPRPFLTVKAKGP